MRRRFSQSASRALLTPARLIGVIAAFFLLVLALIRFAAPDAFVAMVSPVWGPGATCGDGEYVSGLYVNTSSVKPINPVDPAAVVDVMTDAKVICRVGWDGRMPNAFH